VSDALDAVQAALPALAFLLAGVPLAALLDDLGLFEALAAALQRRWAELPVLALWILAALTTAMLNLDTTIVLLTPLYVRLARRSGVDPLPLALVPLLLAAFASSVLPVSNLTTLIAVERLDLGVGDVVRHLAPASAAATVVGWLVYRRRLPARLPGPAPGPARTEAEVAGERRALRIGGGVVAALLVGFTVGPVVGVEPWMAVVVADALLAVVVRRAPWRNLPVGTALGVAAMAALVAVVVPASALEPVRSAVGFGGLAAVVVGGAAAAGVVNNLPATLAVVEGATTATPGVWAWLVGVNVGSVLLPFGALANVLWLRILREEGVELGLRRYVVTVVPLALVPLLVATAVAAATVG
jgi:arsenical pump membrane protein